MSTEQTGGALLDEGGYGCVFMPPLLCINGKGVVAEAEGAGAGADASREGKLDKLLRPSDAEIEFSIAKEIQKIPLWRQYFSVPDSMCIPAPASRQVEADLQDCALLNRLPLGRLRILRSDYAGIALDRLRIQINTFSFHTFMVHLLEGAALMALFGVVHCDLHLGNVLVDKVNVPRIIDFNRAISVHNSDRVLTQMAFAYYANRGLIQVSPDWSIVCGRMAGMKKDTLIDDLLANSVWLKNLQSFFGITAEQQRESLETFYAKSRSAQTGNLPLWFKSYWRLVDSWAVGEILITTLRKLMLWPSFQSTDYGRHATRIKEVLRKMTALNPLERIDSVQALALLDPDNYILRKYAGDWLEKVGKGA